MLSGVKFISREEINNAQDDAKDVSKDKKPGGKDKKKREKKVTNYSSSKDDLDSRIGIAGHDKSGSKGNFSHNEKETVRKRMGLEWMITPEGKKVRNSSATSSYQQEEASQDEADDEHNANKRITLSKHIFTQAERCSLCLENQERPKYLTVSMGNFTYLMLPQWQPIVPGHCCILPMWHESATRTIEKNVWEEIWNFKKCLIMMFGRQEKELVFLETVMNLAKQHRHCLIECIPIPKEVAKEAPLYFKQAIDEVEEEWSQHNAKKLIDTSEKGLRGSIPENFPYFHVEFGLNKGFVHVIDDETQFKASFGLNVLRGMLHLPEEDMHRRRKYESVEVKKQAVTSFARDWEPFDWTKQL